MNLDSQPHGDGRSHDLAGPPAVVITAPGPAEVLNLSGPTAADALPPLPEIPGSERLTLDRRNQILQYLRAIKFGTFLDNRERAEIFAALGVNLTSAGFSQRTFEILDMPENDHDRRDLTESIYSGLLYQLTAKLPEERRANFTDPLLSIGYQLRALEHVPRSAQTAFASGLFDLVLEKKGDKEFVQAQVAQALHFFDTEGKDKAFSRAALGARSVQRTRLLELIVRSCSNLEEISALAAEIGKSRLARHKSTDLEKFQGLAVLGPAFRELEIPELAVSNPSADRAKQHLLELKRFLKEEAAEVLAEHAKLRGNTAYARFSKIVADNLNFLETEMKEAKERGEMLELARVMSCRLQLGFNYLCLVTNSTAKNPDDSRKWHSDELEQVLAAFNQAPEGAILLNKNYLLIKRVSHLSHWSTAAEYDPAGEIWHADLAREELKTHKAGKSRTFEVNFLHELFHFIQQGPYHRVRIVSNRQKVLTSAINKELTRSDGEHSIDRIADALRAAKDLPELIGLIRKVGARKLAVYSGTELDEVVAAGELGSALLKLARPAKLLAKNSQSAHANKRLDELEAALHEAEKLLEGDRLSHTRFSRERRGALQLMAEFLREGRSEDAPAPVLRSLVNRSVLLTKLLLGQWAEVQPAPASAGNWSEAQLQSAHRVCSQLPWFKFALAGLRIKVRLDSDEPTAIHHDPEAREIRIVINSLESAAATKRHLSPQRIKATAAAAVKSLDGGENRLKAALEQRIQRMIGPSDPTVDMDGYMRISNWQLIPSHRYRLLKQKGIGQLAGVTFDGEKRLFDYPYLIRGRQVILEYSSSDKILFSFDVEDQANFRGGSYARTSPWEDIADHGELYCRDHRQLLDLAPPKADWFESHFHLHASDSNFIEECKAKNRERRLREILKARPGYAS